MIQSAAMRTLAALAHVLPLSFAIGACRDRPSAPAAVSEIHVTDAFDMSKAAMTGHVDEGIGSDATKFFAVFQVIEAGEGTRATVDWIAMTDEGEVGLSTAPVTLQKGQIVSVMTIPQGALKAGRYKVGVHAGSQELALRPFRISAP